VSLPYWKEEEIVSAVFNAAYFLGIVVVFDWSAWEEGIAILNNPVPDFEKYDITTLCKLMTIIIRSDKFCEGYLINSFQSGAMLKIIGAMQVQVEHAAKQKEQGKNQMLSA